MIAFGDWHPLDNYIGREIAIVVLLAAAAGVVGFSPSGGARRAARKSQRASPRRRGRRATPSVLEDAHEGRAGDAEKRERQGKRDYLYDLPWYVLIGPPGSGKTTALVNSGLKFPLSPRRQRRRRSPALGGTRYCDWWFTEDAVLIDTAGRYTTQDSDATGDKQSWLAFLDLLKKNRPRQPINGVIVAISLEDLMT